MAYKALSFILFTLAIWRITHMLQTENGPFAIFGLLQSKVGKLKSRNGGIKEMFFCFSCLSIWISIPFAIVMSGSMIEVVIYTLALSSSAILFEHVIE